MRVRAMGCAAACALLIGWLSTTPTRALGKPGITPVPCPEQEWQHDDPSFDALPGAKAFSGRYDGGLYKIEIPAHWNGELVLYAHGFVANSGANGSRLRVGNHPIREHLIGEGFAWAASSYRCNGYVPGQGLLDTMALTDLFTKFNDGRTPRRTYLTGTSMGGHVTVLGMHEFPTAFAGGLAMCPAGPELFDFFGAVSAAAETISGVEFHLDTLQDDIHRMTSVLGAPPDYTDKGRQLASVEIQISGGPRPFAVEGLASRFIPNATASAAALAGSTSPGNRALTNAYFTYRIDEGLGLTADALNARVPRKAADPQIRSASGPYEEVVPYDGRLERPLLTLHGTGDLFVPIFLEQTLAREIAAAGRQNLLVQRVMRIAGHCGFSQPEQRQAFDDLVSWVRTGATPQGDRVDADLRNAGLTFTNPRRPGDPGGLAITAATVAVRPGS